VDACFIGRVSQKTGAVLGDFAEIAVREFGVVYCDGGVAAVDDEGLGTTVSTAMGRERGEDGGREGGRDLLVFHFRRVVEFFVTCLPQHFTKDLRCILIHKFNIVPLLGPKTFCLSQSTSGIGRYFKG